MITAKILLGLGAAVFGLLFISAGGPQPFKVILAVAGTILVFFLPDVMINSRAHERQDAIMRALPDTLDQMTIAVEAGLGFDSAMAKAARGGEGPLAEELIRVLQDMSIGQDAARFVPRTRAPYQLRRSSSIRPSDHPS